ncbi:tetratricopeptide repeat protein [Nostoc sp. LEGE 12447]|uniref:tetratricopeptide repeat protein n=1 Tax=Nostoc sp. LEGE 12447 TaxID=1828640 RepID=UPI00188459B4|nr:tetratricopeptide repeat protein [Nostoc sp. LEGE 12447]MBE9001075.1 tetratricopeptide repeat protein [Nostoc sp. LEGE 12447]
MSWQLRLIGWLMSPLLLTFIPSLLPISSYIVSTTAQAQTSQNRKIEADKLLEQGKQEFERGQYQNAIQSWQQALAIYQELKDHNGEANSLMNLGEAYRNLGQYPKAIEFYQQSLAIFRQIGDRNGEATSLNNLGNVYSILGQYPKAIEFYQQSLAIFRQTGDRNGEATSLNNLGLAYNSLGQYPKAIEFYQQSLAIFRQIGNRNGEAYSLNNLGEAYRNLGQYPKAIEFYQQSLAIFRQTGDRNGEAYSLNNLGLAYNSLGQYPKAIEFYQQSLAIFRQIGDRNGEATSLNNLGNVYSNLGQYPKAIEFYQQSLAIFRQIGNRNGEATSLNNLGLAYRNLGQYPKAIEFYQQSLAIVRQIGDRNGEATSLNNLGNVYSILGQYPKAIEFYQQSLAIVRQIGDRNGEAASLNNLGEAYRNLGQYPKAIEFYQQSLAIVRQIGNRNGEATSLNNLGNVYRNLGQYPKAIEFYQQSLAIVRQIGDREGEGLVLSNIGLLLEKQQQPELAIVFYKQSVNVRESIRQDLRKLPREQQESYTQTVADTYRSLADLLLSQGRLLEAQQVLELLKIQELRDFTRNARAGGATTGISLARIEEDILKKYGTLIAFGSKVYECEQKKCSDLSQLRDQLDALTTKFRQESNTFRKTLQERLATDPGLLEPEQLRSTAAKIVTSEPDTVLIYPLVLKDKIRILLASRAGERGVVFRSFETPINQQELWKTVSKFRTQLSSPEDVTDVKATSKQLYNWLIKPLEGEIKDKNVRHLVFSLDRSTRYIPMAALFDGQQYLIERYTVSTILNAGLTDVSTRLPPNKQNIRVLAMGVSKAFPGFNPLLNVPIELASIVQQSGKSPGGIFAGLEFLNESFTFPTLRDNLTGNQVLHLATHGKFESGRPENSFLLLGTGDELTVEQIQNLQNYMADTHLVVLSACETALGGVDSDGLEMSGISFYFLTNGAKTVVASLWLVNDASTSQLMQQFYQNLATGKMTKAQALQQAQLALLKSDHQGSNNNRSSVRYTPGQNGQTASISRNLSHPFYWAPFILIGNGL